MAVSSNLECRTYEAGQDLSSSQYLFMALASDGQIDPVADAGAQTAAVVGVLQNDPSAAGEAATVAVGGQSKVVAGTGGISVGDLVTSDASGGCVTAVTGDFVLGVCTVAAAATNIGTIDLSVPVAGSTAA